MTSSSPEAPDPAPSSEPQLLTRHNRAAEEVRAARHDHRQHLRDERERRRRRPLRTMFITLLVLLTLVVIGLVVTGISLRKSMRAALPQIDGTLHAAGLSAPVTITRDDHGVPTIQAANLDDLLFAQGFITAQDRLWQMDAMRRHAAGELAEILGSRLIEHDRTQRTLQIRAAADRAIAILPPDQLHQLAAYALGVNSFIAQNADRLPVEFHLLHYKPAPWTPRDSLLILMSMSQDLSTEFPTKLLRESLSAHLAPELLPDLYPVGSWRDHPPTQPGPDLTTPRPEIEQIPLDETQSKLNQPTATPHDLLAARSNLALQTCEGCRSGSNNWAVAGSRSATGLPLVSNDMHLGLGVPDVWYEATLHSADSTLDVTGLTLPGTPFIVVGRNAHVAWSFTNLGADVQDVYIEHLRGSDTATEFQRPDGTWAAAEHHSELIRVRGASDVKLDVITVTHTVGTAQMATPIITPLYPSEHRALSLAWTPYDPTNVTPPFLAANTAANGASLVVAFAGFGGPTLNLVYADDGNHIGYHAIGRIPIRGAAVKHPRQMEQLPLTGPAPSESDEDTLASPQNPNHASFIAAAYRPRRRQPAVAPVQEAPIIPLPGRLDYITGSAIPPVPMDALNPDAFWSGYIPYNELPYAVDPPTGFLATANARITADDYPYAIALNWAAPYRVERITHLLAGSTGLTPADMLHMQMDVHSELDLALAHRIAYALDHAQRSGVDTRRLQQAADILRHWNGDVDINAAAPAIVAATRTELWSMLLTSKIEAHDKAAGITEKDLSPADIAKLYTWQEQGYALEQLVLHTPARWLPPGYTNWNDLLAAAVSRGLSSAHAPSDLTTWSYSKTHPVEFSHPILSMSPLIARILGVTVSSGPRVVGGDTSTIKATSHTFGPTERFTADLSNPNATTSNLTTGQSGNPASPWYLDQLSDWLDGTTLPLPLHDAHIAHTLVLQP